ncbi:cellulose biosynthesis cyclic di-GMP-binding regulatory protein BcsB [Leeuwenhoekiella aequorea]|uniref:cellulose biosynthesis cyclic di-GMP-binding regulatory protein BcsB n=1 Tax=Leeuwenhoekiella aequorea TaxID=283736 RepID=UPI00352FC7A5
MRNKLLFILAVLTVFCAVSVQAQVTYKFSDFDYPEEAVTWGAHSKVSYFIPVKASKLLESNVLQLDFKASDVLDISKSFVTVSVSDMPVATKAPSVEDHTLRFTIPFTAEDIKSGFLKVDVLSNFNIDESICDSYNEGVFWIKRLPSSYINLDYDTSLAPPTATISSFISKADKILLPQNASYELISYAAYIKFYFEREFAQQLEVLNIPETFTAAYNNSILLATSDKLPASVQLSSASKTTSKSNGWLELYPLTVNDTDSISQTQALIVTGSDKVGFKKAAETLLSKDIISSAYSKSLAVSSGMDMSYPILKNDRQVSLRKLGVADEITEGIGKLTKDITLPRSIFGSKLLELELELNFTYRPLKSEENAYVNIYMDDVLKYSHQLDNSGQFDEAITFDHLELKKNNLLRVEFYYIPSGGLCVENPVSFYAQINLDRSKFKAISYKDDENLSFFYFPENFQSATPAIYLDIPLNATHIAALSKFVNLLNPNFNKHRYLYPQILPLDSLKANTGKYSPIIISSKATSLTSFSSDNAYFQLDDTNYKFKKEDYENYFNISYTDKIGVNQLFKKDDLTGMFLFVPDGNAAILELLVDQIDGQTFNNTGDLILASADDSYFFNLRDTANAISDQEIQNGFDLFWQEFRVFIIFGLFIIMTVLLIYIFQKSQESKNNIVDEN